ncbi:MAG: hypothetical protein PVI21_05525 [Candidatus Woesebacteria bacterium]|jgi:hypothetical protein
MNQDKYQAYLAKCIIFMIRDYQDDGDILEFLDALSFSIGMMVNSDRVVNWLDIAGICDQRYYSLKYVKNEPTKLNTKLLSTCENKVNKFLDKVSDGTPDDVLPDYTKMIKTSQKQKNEYQALLAKDIIGMIRNYQDNDKILDYLNSIAFCTAAMLGNNGIVDWFDIAKACDKSGSAALNEKFLISCERQAQKYAPKGTQWQRALSVKTASTASNATSP